MKKFFVFTTVLTLVTFAFTGTAIHALQASDEAELTVIHGIPNLPEPVDIYANEEFLFSFDFQEMVGPLSLPAGIYSLEVKLGDATVLFEKTEMVGGKNYSAIAHLTYDEENGSGIKLSLFENDITPMPTPKSRFTLRHTADAPVVDVEFWRGGQQFHLRALELSNMDAGDPMQFGPVDFPNGYFSAFLFPSGTQVEVFNSGNLYLRNNDSTIVYAVGSITDGTFTLLVQPIRLELPSKISVW
jgi:hypothetical protein